MLEKVWRKGNPVALFMGMLTDTSHYAAQYGDSIKNWE